MKRTRPLPPMDRAGLRRRLEAIHSKSPSQGHGAAPAPAAGTPSKMIPVPVPVPVPVSTPSQSRGKLTQPRHAARPAPIHARSPLLARDDAKLRSLKREYRAMGASTGSSKGIWTAMQEPGLHLGIDRYDVLLLVVSALYVALTPFTKVEESFNTQAAHDILMYGSDLDAYDHHEFPGIVPRTFLGPLAITALAAPLHFAASWLAPPLPKITSLLLVRMVLAMLGVAAFGKFRRVITDCMPYGDMAGPIFGVVCILQFHIPFYLSRPLPNTLALAPVILGLAWWIEGRVERAIAALTVAMAVFRCDIAILLAPIGLMALLKREVSPARGILVGLAALCVSIGVSVAVDSVFWRRWLWPEGEVLYFNTYLNRSGEYGTSPWHWYITSAIPRATLMAFPLAIVACILMPYRLSRVWIPAAAFVALYSILPHKELRFIFPAFPLINALAAVALAGAWSKMEGKWGHIVCSLVAVGLVLVSVAAVSGFALAASYNYPGGDAMWRVQELEAEAEADVDSDPISVFVGVEAAMKGVTHFVEGRHWHCFKSDEQLSVEYYLDCKGKGKGQSQSQRPHGRFKWILASASAVRNASNPFYALVNGCGCGCGVEPSGSGAGTSPAYSVVEYIAGFKRVSVAWIHADVAGSAISLHVPIPQVEVEPVIAILKRT